MGSTTRFELFARLGFAARGLVYLAIGYLAIEAGRNAGAGEALRTMADGGLGKVTVFVIGLGLIGYGAWRAAEAALDLEGAGQGAGGAGVRAGHAVSGLIHILLGLLALGLALGVGVGGGDGDGAETASQWVLDLPGGTLILRLAALSFIAGGLLQGWSAYRLKFLKQLDAQAAGKAWVKWSGRIGYLARGVVFMLIGLLLWRAAGAADPQQAGGTGDALASLSGGTRLLVAAGLTLFGLFSIVQAVYRRITDPHVLQRLRG